MEYFIYPKNHFKLLTSIEINRKVKEPKAGCDYAMLLKRAQSV
jgi:hypothetical protein